jgi:hypothetical protein
MLQYLHILISWVSVHKIVNYFILNTTFYYAWTHEQAHMPFMCSQHE